MQQRNADRTKARILAAAIEEFAARGIAGARVDRIAEVAGCNKAMLYAYFGNKDGLFDAAFSASVDQYLDEVRATMERDPQQREGQAYFNAIRLRWPELQAEVIGTDRDPFSNDRNLPAFLDWLQARLG